MLLVVCFLLPQPIKAQFSKSDIVSIYYRAIYGGMFAYDDLIMMEIMPDKAIRMYNDTYDSSAMDKLEGMAEKNGGSISMSVEDFQKKFVRDSLTYLYTGRISNTEYDKLLDKIIEMKARAMRFDMSCCCDVPERLLIVHFKNGTQKFLECERSNKDIAALMIYLDGLAFKKGYKKSTAKFDLRKNFP